LPALLWLRLRLSALLWIQLLPALLRLRVWLPILSPSRLWHLVLVLKLLPQPRAEHHLILDHRGAIGPGPVSKGRGEFAGGAARRGARRASWCGELRAERAAPL